MDWYPPWDGEDDLPADLRQAFVTSWKSTWGTKENLQVKWHDDYGKRSCHTVCRHHIIFPGRLFLLMANLFGFNKRYRKHTTVVKIQYKFHGLRQI